MQSLSKSDLFDYQKRAVNHIVTNNGSMLWVDIGLGKTTISLTAIEHLLDSYNIKGALVVAPLKVVEAVWEQEAELWSHTSRLKFSVVRGTPKERVKALKKQADIYLINYEQLRWLAETVQQEFIELEKTPPFDMVVFDEVTKMKTSTAKRVSKFAKLLLPFMRFRVGLTGSPGANGYLDLHGQYLVVDGGYRLGPSITNYKDRWFIHDAYAQKWTPRRGAAEDIRAKIADITLEMSSDDYAELPPLVDQDWRVTLPENLQEQYDTFEKEFFVALDGGEVEAFNASAKSMKCRQFANGAIYTDLERKNWLNVHDLKLDVLEEIKESVGDKPLLVCYQFRHDKEKIASRFPEAQFLDRTNVAEKVAAWNRGEIKMLVGHPLSMGHGLNLQHGGNNIVWYGLDWSLELYDQAIGRLLRRGQKGEVVVNHRIIVDNTGETCMCNALGMKDRTQADLRTAIKDYRLKKWGV